VLICLTVGSGIFAAEIWSNPFVGSEEATMGSQARVVVAVFFAAALTYPVTLLLSSRRDGPPLVTKKLSLEEGLRCQPLP
jgi:hypothetical protein